jgi:DeoR/GlpR family transcriptional regulator of sugar metabolism
MFAQERQKLIDRVLAENGRALVTELSVRFAVSQQTIRKDLMDLEEAGRVMRTHGGAITVDRGRPELAFDVRRRLQADAKRKIALAAAAIVRDGETIALDASTTALELARRLRERGGWQQLTILTNGLRIAEELAGQAGITVLVPGGRLRWEALSVVGPLGKGFFRSVNIARAFVGAAGFTLTAGLTDASEEEAQLKRAMVSGAAEVIAIIDHTKWTRVALATFCKTERIASVVTDAPAPDDLVEATGRAGIGLIQAAGENAENPPKRAAGVA